MSIQSYCYYYQLSFNIQSIMIEVRQRFNIPDNIVEANGIQNKFRTFNQKMFSKRDISVTVSFLNFSVKGTIPQKTYIISDNFSFKPSNTALPKPPNQSLRNIKFPFYSKRFYIIYFLIGQQGEGIWNQFRKAYQTHIPQQQWPIKNMSTSKNIHNLRSTIKSFIESGLQLKIIFDNDFSHLKSQMKDIYNHQSITQVIIQGKIQDYDKWDPKFKIKRLIRKYYQQEIQSVIKGTLHLKQGIYNNFVNLQSKSQLVFMKKRVIQQCINSKQLSQHKQNHEKFTEMLKDYKNVGCLRKLQKQMQKSSKNYQEISKINNDIKKIQQQQQKFCEQFKKVLDDCISRNKQIQLLDDNQKQKIYFKIVNQYKQEHSIYQIMNNSIKFSLSVNQNNVSWLSTFIKYLYESIQYFYNKQKSKFPHQKLYRGTMISDEQYQSLQQGDILMNLAFMSTSSDQRTAKSFLPKNSNNALFITILLGDQFKDPSYKVEGFIQLEPLYKDHRISQFKNGKSGNISDHQYQVLFNPLNVFQIISIQSKKNQKNQIKYLTLQYAPQLAYYKKRKNGNITQKQRKKFQPILANLLLLTKSNFDKGKDLHIKGKVTKALEHYQGAEKNGQVLTSQQRFHRINIYKQRKDHDKVQQLLNQQKAQFEQKYQKIDKISKIINLNKQSEYLNILSNYYLAEQKAEKANTQLEQLKDTIAKQLQETIEDRKKATLTHKKVIQCYLLDINLLNQLAKTRYQKNDNKQSMHACVNGFLSIDLVYQIYEEVAFLKYKKQIDKVLLNIKLTNPQLIKNLLEIRNLEQHSISQQQQSKKLRQKIKKLQDNKAIFKKIFDRSQMIEHDLLIRIDQYFQKRQSPSVKFQYFSNAYSQIQNLLGQSSEIKSVIGVLSEFKSSIDELRSKEKQFYTIMKQNLKVINRNIIPCLMSQKKNYYRLQSQDYLQRYYRRFREQIQKQSYTNTQRIIQHNLLCSFLHQCSYVQQKQQQSLKLREYADKMSSQLLQKVNKQCSQNKDLNLTSQKTQIILTQIQKFRNQYVASDIIEKATVQKSQQENQSKAKCELFRTSAAFKTKQNFLKLLQKFTQLQQIHQNDDQIDKTHNLLQDLVGHIQILNNSQAVVAKTQQYKQYLEQANQKIAKFKEKYERFLQKMNQKLAQFYYQQASNKLRRGYFKQAQILISNTKTKLQKIYKEQDKGEGKYNKLIARDVPIKIYRLQAQIIGIYGQSTERADILAELVDKMKFIYRQAPQMGQSLASIHQSVAFVAVRCLPKTIGNRNQNYGTALHSLKQSIQLRNSRLGNQNQFLAVSYTYLICIKANFAPEQQLYDQYQKAKSVFNILNSSISQNIRNTHLQKQPTLYLHRMTMQANYFKTHESRQAKEEKVAQSYKQNIKQFNDNNKGVRSLQIVEQILEGGEYLLKKDGYQQEGQKYLQICEKQIQQLILLNKDVSGGTKTSIDTINKVKFKILPTFYNFYRKKGDDKKKKKYLKLMEQAQSRTNNRPDIRSSQGTQQQGFIPSILHDILQCFGVNYN